MRKATPEVVLLLALFLLPGAASAAETATAGSQATQATVSALNSKIDTLLSMMQGVLKCNTKRKLYAPADPKKDGDGCVIIGNEIVTHDAQTYGSQELSINGNQIWKSMTAGDPNLYFQYNTAAAGTGSSLVVGHPSGLTNLYMYRGKLTVNAGDPNDWTVQANGGNYGAYGSGNNIGLYGVGGNYGVYGTSAGGWSGYFTGGNLGVYGYGNTHGVYGSAVSYGVFGTASSGWSGYFSGAYGVHSQNNAGYYTELDNGGYGLITNGVIYTSANVQTPTLCLNGDCRSAWPGGYSFGGAYSYYTYYSYGPYCGVANPYTGACNCPSGYGAVGGVTGSNVNYNFYYFTCYK